MKHISLSFLLILAFACNKSNKSNSSENLDSLEESIESGINSISGSADDATNGSITAKSKYFINPLEYLINSAHAASCSRNLTNSGGGVCARNVNCEFGAYTWSGSVELNFQNGTSCSFSEDGDYFTREVNFIRTGPLGSLSTSSDPHTNYEGNVVNGGIQVTQNADGYEMEILGQSKILTSNSLGTLFDISVETVSPIQLNQLSRNGRIASSGTVVVYHNLAKYKSTHVYTNLEWSSSCCYPIAGSVEVTLAGSKTGSGTVTFNGCGTATTSFDELASIELSHCE